MCDGKFFIAHLLCCSCVVMVALKVKKACLDEATLKSTAHCSCSLLFLASVINKAKVKMSHFCITQHTTLSNTHILPSCP